MNIDLKHGDCVEVLAALSESSIGSVISDPPYGLSFMGKDFDKLGDGESQQRWHKEWLEQAYRVLKPGGVIKAFSGTRTYHRLIAAMEQAGFTDIRLEAWCYGNGFPKSLNISLACDKAARGHPQDPDKRSKGGKLKFDGAALATNRTGDGASGLSKEFESYVPDTEEARQHEGWGTALKPAWEPVLVGRKPTL